MGILKNRALILVPSLADVVFLCIFLSLAFIPNNGLLNDADTGYHIRAGEYILQTFSVPRHDIFSFLTPPLPWTAHEWLSEVIMAIAHKFHGLTGVVLLFSLMIAAEYYLMLIILRTYKGDVLSDILIVLLVIASSQIHWLARPHIFSLLLMTIWYYLLDQYQQKNRNYLYLLPPLMLLWVNLHGGFVSGFLLSGIYFAGNALNFFFSSGPEKNQYLKRVKTYGLLIGSCLLVTVINPYGMKILLFPFRLISNTFLMDNVLEFLSPNFHQPLLIFKYLLFLMIIVLSVSPKRPTLIELMLVIFFTYMALQSARYIPLYAVIIAPVLSGHAAGTVGLANGRIINFFRKRSEHITEADLSIRGGLWPLVAVLVVVGLAEIGQVIFSFDSRRNPVAAVDFLKKEQIRGNMFNNDEFGDYIIYSAWPQYRVFFDGRSDMYGTERAKDYIKVSEVQQGWEEVLTRYRIDWVIFQADSHLSTVLRMHKDWQLIYADKLAHIFVRKIPAYDYLINKYPDVKVVLAATGETSK